MNHTTSPGLEVDQRGIIELLCAADVGRAKADEAAGKPEHAKRDPPAGRDLVLGVDEQRIVVAGLLAEPHRVLAKRPVEALAALGRQIVAEIFVDDDRFGDGGVQALDVGQLLRRDAGKLVAVLDDRDVAAVRRLLRAKRRDDVGARLRRSSRRAARPFRRWSVTRR